MNHEWVDTWYWWKLSELLSFYKMIQYLWPSSSFTCSVGLLCMILSMRSWSWWRLHWRWWQSRPGRWWISLGLTSNILTQVVVLARSLTARTLISWWFVSLYLLSPPQHNWYIISLSRRWQVPTVLLCLAAGRVEVTLRLRHHDAGMEEDNPPGGHHLLQQQITTNSLLITQLIVYKHFSTIILLWTLLCKV